MFLSLLNSPLWNYENFSMKEKSQYEHTQIKGRKDIQLSKWMRN